MTVSVTGVPMQVLSEPFGLQVTKRATLPLDVIMYPVHMICQEKKQTFFVCPCGTGINEDAATLWLSSFVHIPDPYTQKPNKMKI